MIVTEKLVNDIITSIMLFERHWKIRILVHTRFNTNCKLLPGSEAYINNMD